MYFFFFTGMAEHENVNSVDTTESLEKSDITDSVLLTSENMNNENREKELIESRVSANRVVPESDKFVEEFDSTDEEDEGVKKVENSSVSASQSQGDYAEHITYNDKGIAIYTEPVSKYQYEFCKTTSQWIPYTGSSDKIVVKESGENVADTPTTSGENNPYENEHYRYCHEKQEWILKETVTENEHYKWCNETKTWIPKVAAGTADIKHDFVDGQHIYTDADGMIFFWDTEKKAWFPKIDDDFMAIYQMNYGFIDNTSDDKKDVTATAFTTVAKLNEADKQLGGKRKLPSEPPKWFEIAPEHNTKVYISNLPLDITDDEFAEVMAKCGMIMKDPQTQKLKLKLYRDEKGQPKGDGLCDYIKVRNLDNLFFNLFETKFCFNLTLLLF